MKGITVLVTVAVALIGCAATPDPSARILTYKQYSSIQHSTPYVLEFTAGDGALLMYGVRHTFDPSDSQITDIKQEWERFRPTVAYNEGGNPPSEVSIEQAVRKWGESGLVRFLAAQHRVPVATFEPSKSAEAQALMREFSREQVKVFLALRAYLTFRRSESDRTETEFMNSVLRDKEGIQGSPSDVEELDASFARLFSGHSDWRKVQDTWFDPTKSFQYTNEAQSTSAFVRDQHIFQVLVARARRGDRVFAVIGASHVPVQEPALIAALGSPSRKREGIE